jgi:hypothetical protein
MGFDTFALIVNFLNWEWVCCDVMIGLFEAPDTSGTTLEEIVQPFFSKVRVDKQGNCLCK